MCLQLDMNTQMRKIMSTLDLIISWGPDISSLSLQSFQLLNIAMKKMTSWLTSKNYLVSDVIPSFSTAFTEV